MEASVQAHAHCSAHQRTWALLPKCGAKTRGGRPCLGLVVRGKRRCRMHGGAKGSGAQLGNHNRLTHGRYTRDQTEVRALLALDAALNSLLLAEMNIVGVVAQGEQEELNQAMQIAEERGETLRRAAAVMERFLVKAGRTAEAQDLAAQIAAFMPLTSDPNRMPTEDSRRA